MTTGDMGGIAATIAEDAGSLTASQRGTSASWVGGRGAGSLTKLRTSLG